MRGSSPVVEGLHINRSITLQVGGGCEPGATEVESVRSLRSLEEIAAAVQGTAWPTPILAAVVTTPRGLMT